MSTFTDKIKAALNKEYKVGGGSSWSAKPLYCIETGEVFDTITDACIAYGIDVDYSLGYVPKPKHLEVKFHFKVVETTSFDRLDFITGKSLKVTVAKKKAKTKKKKVLCVETGIIYESISDAIEVYGPNVRKALTGARKTVSKCHFTFVQDEPIS